MPANGATGTTWQTAGDDAAGWLYVTESFDWKGRIVRRINSDSNGSDGKDQLFDYAGCGCAGNQITTIQSEQVNGTDRRTQKIYQDWLGRTSKTEILNWNSSVYSTVVNAFNIRDQIIDSIQSAGAQGGSPNQTTSLIYDGYGRLKTQKRPEQTSPSTYNYRPDDSISSVVDARGAITEYFYTNRGLVNLISYQPPSGVPDTADVAFTYDAVGNRTQMNDGPGVVDYSYNELSQMTSETRRFDDSLPDAPLVDGSRAFNLEYGYTAAGQLKSLKDPFGQQFNYAHDKVGRLSSVTGTTAFDTITNYAINPTYNARGTLTGLSYGNGVQMAVTGFNTKLQATGFEVKKGTDFYIKKQYQFYSDGSLKFIDDQLSDNFDRLYKYDFAGRTVEAKAGTAARGQSPTPPHNFDQPYTMQYTHNAFGHLTSKTGYYYSSYDTNTYGYDSANRNASWGYDAEGNITADDDAVYETDAAGRTVKTTERKLDEESQFDAPTMDYFDGDGQLVKRVTNAGSTTPAEMKRYFIRSGVLNKVVSESDATGRKLKTFVPANGATLAQQSVDYSGGTPYESLSFLHTDASGTGAQKSLATGALVGNTTHSRTGEYSPLGRNIADASPYITLNSEPPADEGGVDLFGSGAGYRPGRNSYSIDGLTVPEDMFMLEINSGRIGGAFGLLQMSAQMSAPRYTVYDRWGLEVYSGRDWGATRSAAYQTETLTAYRTLNVSWSVIGLLATQTQRQQNREDPPGYQVDLAITGADRRLRGNCLREVTNLLGTAAERLFDNPDTRENEYTQRIDGNESIKDIYERDILTAVNIINSLWNATQNIDAGNPNVTPGSETDNSFSNVDAEAQGGTTLNVYGGFFRRIERGRRLPRPDARGLRYEYGLTGRTSNAEREITMLHEALHLVVNGFSDQLLGSIILNRNINNVTRAQGSQAITGFLNRHCR